MHVHVRKCGGSTFYQDVLRRNLGDGFYRDASLIDDRYSRDQVNQILSNCPWLTGYSSHKISLDLPYERDDTNVCAIAMVRDPVRRFVSHFSYLRHHSKDWDPIAKQSEADEYVQQAVKQGWVARQRQHSQLEQLSNRRGSQAMEWIQKTVEENPVILCPVDRFDDLCLLLENRFPNLILNAAYPDRTNKSPPIRITEANQQMLRDAIDSQEFTLVEYAHRWFDAEFRSEFPDAQTADELRMKFQARCRNSVGWLSKLRHGK